jgi:hypothetical protein
MSKQITYDPKITNANTQYNKIDQNDMDWLLKELMRYLAMMAELSNSNNEDVKAILRDWYSKRNKLLPKGKNGLNSPESMLGGLLNNLAFGKQNDLSDIQMLAISDISRKMALIYQHIQELNLQSTQQPFLEIVFRQKLFSIG